MITDTLRNLFLYRCSSDWLLIHARPEEFDLKHSPASLPTLLSNLKQDKHSSAAAYQRCIGILTFRLTQGNVASTAGVLRVIGWMLGHAKATLNDSREFTQLKSWLFEDNFCMTEFACMTEAEAIENAGNVF